MDETSIYYEMALKKGGQEKENPTRRVKKLPILFIIKGVPGGDIKKTSSKHTHWGTTIASKKTHGWMLEVGTFYADEVLPQELDGPAVMIADNFDCHVSADDSKSWLKKLIQWCFLCLPTAPQPASH
ncbi:hypothetical protein PHPALM_30782 [Phytophthora palmivora]|uniref:DDE-1 domain-containing protein n=1 Tax=Phytophthora palmivora TaxID=4796 RepID=A0A2P4X499_9STRA|nr:hypothetical protein PHPALM_30782 [Phytophthora palmivora]